MRLTVSEIPRNALDEIRLAHKVRPNDYFALLTRSRDAPLVVVLVTVAACFVIPYHSSTDWLEHAPVAMMIAATSLAACALVIVISRRLQAGPPRVFLAGKGLFVLEGHWLYVFSVRNSPKVDVRCTEKTFEVLFSYEDGDQASFSIDKERANEMQQFAAAFQSHQSRYPRSSGHFVALDAVVSTAEQSVRAATRTAYLLAVLNQHKVVIALTACVLAASPMLASVLIDENAYRSAVDRGTVTAFREYLGRARNARHSAEARDHIRRIYDRYIAKYRSDLGSLPGAEALIRVLVQLRDGNSSNVQLRFERTSAVSNHAPPGIRLKDATPAFSPDRNSARESRVVAQVNQALGLLFPTDVFVATQLSDPSTPVFMVSYRYQSVPGSLYYPVAQEARSIQERDYYQGIEILWRFALLASDGFSGIDAFSLQSRPAMRFTTASKNVEGVYESMADSAFEDFLRAFRARYISSS